MTGPFDKPPVLDVAGLSVLIAIPVNRDFPWQTTQSLMQTVIALTKRGVTFDVQFLTNGSQIDHVRSSLSHQFMKSKHNRLFWIDSDMSWAPEAFLRILALSTKMPIVGASYPAKSGPGCQFLIDMEGQELEANPWGCFSILGMGIGFTCVAREVMEKITAASPVARSKYLNHSEEAIAWTFKCGLDDDNVFRSEDMHFFKKCRDLGYQVWVDPSVELGHVGGKEWRGRLIDALTQKGAK